MVLYADKLLNKGDIIRFPGFSDQPEPGLFRQLMAFLVVAVGAGAHQVLPGVFSAVNLGDDMVDRHHALFAAAIQREPSRFKIFFRVSIILLPGTLT